MQQINEVDILLNDRLFNSLLQVTPTLFDRLVDHCKKKPKGGAMYFTAFIDWFIHDKLKSNSEDLNRARVFIGFTLALSIGVVIFSFVYFGLGASQGGIAVVLGGVMFLLSTFVVKYSGAIRMAAYQFE